MGHTAPVREDSLQQQAALLLGPFQAMLPSKPYRTLNFGINVGSGIAAGLDRNETRCARKPT